MVVDTCVLSSVNRVYAMCIQYLQQIGGGLVGGVVFILDRPVLSSLTFAQYEEKEETGGCTDGLEGVLDPIRLELISGSFRLL